MIALFTEDNVYLDCFYFLFDNTPGREEISIQNKNDGKRRDCKAISLISECSF